MSTLQVHRESLPAADRPGASTTATATSGARLLIRLVGDADVDHAEPLSLALDALKRETPALVVLDLSGLAFISSLGIGQLFTFAHALRRSGGEARLAAAQPDVAEALKRCRAEAVMKVFPTVAAACA